MTEELKTKTLTLAPLDAAWIFRHIGYDAEGNQRVASQMMLPKMEDGEAIVPPHIIAMSAAMMRIVAGDEKFMNNLAEWLVDDKGEGEDDAGV